MIEIIDGTVHFVEKGVTWTPTEVEMKGIAAYVGFLYGASVANPGQKQENALGELFKLFRK